jgi:hypothetical protein
MAEGGAPPPEQLSNEGLTAEASNPFSGLPYRMVFAVATLDSVMVYDTQVGMSETGCQGSKAKR